MGEKEGNTKNEPKQSEIYAKKTPRFKTDNKSVEFCFIVREYNTTNFKIGFADVILTKDCCHGLEIGQDNGR